MILVDGNVIVAALIDEHIHNEPSAAFIAGAARHATIIAAHSIAESYVTMTRQRTGFALAPAEARDVLDDVAERFTIVALSAVQTLDAVRRFSALGSGPRLYDYLIGATGVRFGADTIVTWNPRHFIPPFPSLRIVTPAEATSPPP